MNKIYICQKCEKPKSSQVEGKPQKGKKLLKSLDEQDDLNIEVIPCKCLGKCKKGPNGLAMPGRVKLHRLSIRKIEKLAASH